MSRATGTRSTYTGTRSSTPTQTPTFSKNQRAPTGPFTSPRAILREKWARIFGGPSFLEGGTSNRLVLALRSPLPDEIDWSLDRLIQVSGQDPDLLRFTDFPGLLDGLAALIRAFFDAGAAARADADAFYGLWVDQARETTTRRATEAALVLRNLATEATNTPALLAYKRLTRVTADALEEGEKEVLELGEGVGTSTEMRLYLLEVLEVVGQDIPLVLPGRAVSKAPGAAPEPATSPSVRLFPLLVSLTRSPDRALVLAAYRCLISLSLNDSSDPVFALMTFPPDSPFPHPIQTAIELLPLADAELATAMFDFVYQHTLLPANAVEFCARPELGLILRLATSKLHVGAQKEVVDCTLPAPNTDAETYWKALPPRHRLKVRPGEGKDPSPKMSQWELAELLKLADADERGLTWMRLAFEPFPDGEVTQVALWTAYRTEFEPHSISSPMLAAADVIKMSTEAFPTALPMVTDGPDKRFIIKGIRIRDRADMKAIFRCRWLGCLHPTCAISPEKLYWHLHHHHLSTYPPPSQCAWPHCTYRPSPSSLLDPITHIADLSLHVRTHIPAYHPSPGYGTPPAPPPPPVLPETTAQLQHERYHAQVDEHAELTGLAFLAALVLRNVARTVKLALGNPAGGASVTSLSGGEESIFEAFSKAEEGGVKRDEVVVRLEKVDYSLARSGAKALGGLEERLVRTTMEDFNLGKVLLEVVEVAVLCRKAEDAELKKASPPSNDVDMGTL